MPLSPNELKELENKLITEANNANINRLVVGGIIKNKKIEILLLKRAANDFLGGLVELPSGKVEQNESLFDALKREIKEEANMVITNIQRYNGHFDYKSKSGTNTRQFNFEIEVENLDSLKISDEHEEAYWISKENYENFNLSDAIKNILNEINS